MNHSPFTPGQIMDTDCPDAFSILPSPEDHDLMVKVSGMMYVLETLGVSWNTFEELRKQKEAGSCVVVFAKVSGGINLDEAVDNKSFTDDYKPSEINKKISKLLDSTTEEPSV